MNDDRHTNGDNRDAAQALEVLRRLPRSASSENARARARAAFVDGTGVMRLVPDGPRRSRGRIWASLMAAALFCTVALLFVGSTPTEHWVVVDATEGSSRVIGLRLESGVLSTGPGEEIEVQLGDRLRIRMLAGTSVELPRAPGRWIDQVRGLTIASGEIYGTTGGRPLGFPLTFVSDELRAKITGTTFAVFRTEEASCVCLWEGGITVDPQIGDHPDVVLTPEQRVWVFRDARAPEVMPLDPMEVMKLQMMNDAGIPDRD